MARSKSKDTRVIVATDPRWGGAAGLSYLRPGFCSSPDHDALFALGWPHIRFVMDGHREDDDPRHHALRILALADPPLRFGWSRTVAQGVVRGWGLPSLFELAPGVQGLRREAEEAVWKSGPITPREAAALLCCRLGQDSPGVTHRGVETFVLLLEALVGADVVGGAVLDLLEQFSVDTLLTEWSLPPHVTFQMGFLMLRVPRVQQDAWTVRMKALLERCFEARPSLRRHGFRMAGGSHARSLHLVLNGGLAAENSSDRALRWYVHVTDDPVLVRMRVAVNRLAYEPDARLVFLGGLDVLSRYARDWPKLATTDAQRWFFEQVAPIAAPEMYPLMLEMAGRSRVRPEAIGWFLKNAEATTAFLEEAATGDGTSAAHARSVRRALATAA